MRKFFTLLVLFTLCGTLQAQDPCPNNHSLDFTPSSPGTDYLQPANPPIASGASDFTLEARFRCESPAGSSFRRLLSMGGSGTGSAQFEVCESNGYLRFFWGTTVYPTGTPPATLFIKDGNWHHVAAVRSGSGFLVYIDGVLVFTSPTSLPALNNFTRLRIGAFWNGVSATTAWDGQIDEVRVWNTVRTPTQISTYRNCPLPTCSESGLVLYYKLDEGVAYGSNPNVTLADDCSSSNNNGTLNGPFALTGTSSNWVCGDSLFGATCCPADFSWTRDSCGNVQFTNLTQQPVPPTYTYAWDFDNDGVTDSTLPNPSWNYPTQGNHTVCLSLITATGAVFCETCKTVASLSFLTGPPIIVTCSPDISISCGNPYQVPIPVVSNNYCSDQLNITGSRSDLQLMNAPFPLGITVITWTATNEFGSNTCTNTVTVFDNDIPVPLVPVLPDLIGSCGSLIVNAPAAIDFCNSNGGIIYGTPSAPVGILLNTNPPSYQLAPGNYVITWVYNDGNGNVITQPQNISVLMDNVPPVAICQNVMVNLSGSTVTVTPQMVDNGSFDDCCPVTLSFPNAPNGLTFSCQDTCPLPPQTVVLLVTDCNGNTSTCTAQVTLVDNSPPIVVCNDQIFIQVDASGFAFISANDVLEGQAIDNCGISDLFLDTDGFSCDVACGPPQTVVLTAVDCAGNTATCTTQVFVFDAIAPIISCPANVSVSTDPGSCQATVSAPVTFNDNCGVLFLEYTLSGATAGNASGQIQSILFNVGTTICTYIAQDGCGNTATCSFTVTVFDFEPPVIIDCPQDISVTGSLALGGTNVSWSDPVFIDNCSGVTMWGSSHISGDFFPCGVTAVNYFSVDNFGNSAFCFFTVTVDCPPDVCQCGGFTNLTFGAAGTPAGLSVACNQAFTVPCPVAGTNFSIAGQFACSDTSCAASNLVWELHNSSGMIGSGNLGGLNFTLPIAGNTIQTPGSYTLYLRGDCGQTTCQCEVLFVVPDCDSTKLDTLACGDAVVTCFSGLPGASGVVAAIKKLQNVYSLPTGNDLSGSIATSKMWLKTELGEVFGIAIDNTSGDVYFTSTTMYGPTASGPNGYGGVYKVDGNTLLVDPAWGTGLNLPNATGSALTSAFSTISHAPGLGNICYDQWNDQLFVTNFEDGKIYRIDPAGIGTVLEFFDPFGDDGLAGFAPVGKRPWGIGVTRNTSGEVEVYYAVWTVDKVRNGGGAYNSIRRVKLNPGGSFDTGSDTEVVPLPYTLTANYSNPVSDIAFSQDGKTMLLAEHTMEGDMKPNNGISSGWAHQSRLLRYEKTGGTWTYDQTIPIGEYGSGTFGRNSAGGVDFGNYISLADSISACDTSIWCTGDYLKIFGGNKVYGMQGFYEDNATVTNANSWLLDFDGQLAQYDKSLLGDVEIFKCTDCPTVNICDGISAIAIPDSNATGCCYTLNIGNQTPDYFTYVNISVIDGGSLVTSPPPVAGTGWTLQGYSGSSAIFQPSGGTIPVGSQQVADFCLENLTADEQTIVIEYYGLNDSVVCRDTLTLKCDACVQAFVDSVYCEGWNQYSANICIKAGENLGSPAGSATLVPLGGVTFSVALPNVTESDGSVVVSLPDVQPGDTYCSIPIQINGATGGQQVCFYAIIHDGDIPAGEDDLFCCADTIPICFQLPECDPCSDSTTYATAEQMMQNGDSCCWEITLHNPPGYYTGVSTEIITPGVTFGAVNNFPPTSGWLIGSYTPTNITWDPFGVQGTHVQDGWMMPVVCFEGTVPGPWELAVTWYAEDSTECYDTLSFLCTPIDDNECVRLDTFDLVCIDDSTYIFNFTATNVSENPTITADHVVLGQIKPTPPPYNVFDPATHWQTLLPNASGSFSSLLYGNPGDTICFVIALHDVNDDSLHLYCCVSDTFCVVLPPCGQGPECADNIVQNGDFQQGTVTGDIGFDGNVDFWTAVTNSTPQATTGAGCAQNGSVHMWGNQVVGEGISQVLNFQQGFAYDLSLCAAWIDQVQPNARIRVRATDGDIIEQGDYFGCNLPECEEIFLTPILTTSWQTYIAPTWIPQNDYNRLVLTVWNNSNIDSGGEVSWARVDDICIGESQLPIQFSVRAFPNPTSGDLTLAFERAAPTSATLRVFDMFGRLVKTERVAEAQLQYELSLNGLPQGVYFVEIGGTEGRLWGQRIVKE